MIMTYFVLDKVRKHEPLIEKDMNCNSDCGNGWANKMRSFWCMSGVCDPSMCQMVTGCLNHPGTPVWTWSTLRKISLGTSMTAYPRLAGDIPARTRAQGAHYTGHLHLLSLRPSIASLSPSVHPFHFRSSCQLPVNGSARNNVYTC
jgi:hypothetical protein